MRVPLLGGVRAALRRHALRSAIARIRRLPARQMPDRSVIETLRYGWGNPDYAAATSYLEATARHVVESEGPILECGSGISTILLGLLAAPQRREIWTLEHDQRWHAMIARFLREHSITSVVLCQCPLRSYGDYSWYDPPLHRMPARFSLVICDGPPNTTPGGRYGLVPVMRERLSPTWNILLDDPRSAKRTGTLDRWTAEPGVFVTQHEATDAAFLWVTRSTT